MTPHPSDTPNRAEQELSEPGLGFKPYRGIALSFVKEGRINRKPEQGLPDTTSSLNCKSWKIYQNTQKEQTEDEQGSLGGAELELG